MQEIDLIITGSKALLLDSQNTCLDDAAIAINAGDIVAVGHPDIITKQFQAKKTITAGRFSDYAGICQLSHARGNDLFPRHGR